MDISMKNVVVRDWG